MKIIKQTKASTDFVVMPKDLNYMGIIFGGAFMSQLDLAAATLVNRAIRQSDTTDKAVTYKFDVEFSKPCYDGDIVTIDSEITEVRKKAIVVKLRAYREGRNETAGRQLVAVAKTVFVSMKGNHFLNHQLKLPE